MFLFKNTSNHTNIPLPTSPINVQDMTDRWETRNLDRSWQESAALSTSSTAGQENESNPPRSSPGLIVYESHATHEKEGSGSDPGNDNDETEDASQDFVAREDNEEEHEDKTPPPSAPVTPAKSTTSTLPSSPPDSSSTSPADTHERYSTPPSSPTEAGPSNSSSLEAKQGESNQSTTNFTTTQMKTNCAHPNCQGPKGCPSDREHYVAPNLTVDTTSILLRPVADESRASLLFGCIGR